MKRWLKAFGIALIGRAKGVYRRRKVRIFFNKPNRCLVWLAQFFYDVRRSRSGRIYFQMRDKRREHRALKHFLHRHQRA